MKQIIAMHGWCGDSTTWQPWSHHFQQNGWHWQSGERGYGGKPVKEPKWQKSSAIKLDNQKVIIAHSLGPHLLDHDVLSKATKVVLICSFSEFIPKGPSKRVVETALKGMQSQLGTLKETSMLTTFLKRACSPLILEDLPKGPVQDGLTDEGRIQLKADLDLLARTKKLPRGLPIKAKVLVIEGMQDEIVAPLSRKTLIEDLSNHLEKPPSHWELPGMGHALFTPDLIQNVHTWLESSQ